MLFSVKCIYIAIVYGICLMVQKIYDMDKTNSNNNDDDDNNNNNCNAKRTSARRNGTS